jgi:hypothetical protein
MANIIKAGRCTAICRERQWAHTKKQEPQILLSFEILDEGEDFGRRITWYGFFTEKTRDSTLKALRACGWVGDDLENLGALDAQVSLVIEHEDDDGKQRAKVRWVNSLGFKVTSPMSPSDLKAFAASMRETIRAQKPAGQTPPSNGARNGGGYNEINPPPVDDDDL